MIKKLKNFIIKNNLDGYIVPKNDEYFTEYSNVNNLVKISNFTGSAGFIFILKNNNYLFVDGRYTIQAKKQSGKKFKILEIPHVFPKDISGVNGKKIGFNPKLFTEETLYKYFKKKVKLVPIQFNFKNKVLKKKNGIFNLKNSIAGETSLNKVKKIKNFLSINKMDYLYISASENVNWVLNIRGKDLPNSPLANCKLIISKYGKLYMFTEINKITNLKKFKNTYYYNKNDFFHVINKLKKKKFCIDKNTCSIFEKAILESKFKIVSKNDPIYELKSIKNAIEIKNTFKAHIEDGIALTNFLYWFKHNKKKITEKQIENKIENYRIKSKNYLYPSFDTIAGSGPNGSIIHYKCNNITNRELKKNDILLIDSGGQYKWGTTDVTRTVSCGKVPSKIKINFTRVLKGHIAVVNCDLSKYYNGYLIDKLARKFLNSAGLDYSHGTGHGVGFFLNVHEGPQGITKFNKVTLKKGMILSNEPGYYLNDKYGIRIENLIYIDQIDKKLIFKNFTYAPIDLDMINFKMLTAKEKDYLFSYHREVYSRLSRHLGINQKKWLKSLIK